jgi:hypothetical protein
VNTRAGGAGVPGEVAAGTAGRILVITIEHMTIQRMDHVGIVVDDLAAATEFFVGRDSYRLCYVRGPEGVIIELAEQTG